MSSRVLFGLAMAVAIALGCFPAQVASGQPLVASGQPQAASGQPLPARSAAGGAPQEQPVERAETLVLHAHQLEHQPAREALPLVEPMLSPRGSLELRAQTNTLVIRDHASIVDAVRAALREFDHPPIDLVLDLYILSVSRREGELPRGADISDLPPALVEGLGSMVRFNEYQLLAEGQLLTREGQPVSYELGSRYTVSFQVGTVLGARRLKLRGFEVSSRRGTLSETLVATDINLTLRRMLVLGFVASESSDRGLAVAVTCRPRSALDVRLGGS